MRQALQALCAFILLFCSALLPAQASDSLVPPTRMESFLDALRERFPSQVVIGFEEIEDETRGGNPATALGPPNATLPEVLARIRRANPRYKVDLLPGGVVHVYPVHRSIPQSSLLDFRLTEFSIPPVNCIAQQIGGMAELSPKFSYTPELSSYLWQKKENWYGKHNRQLPGVVGDFLGDCLPDHHRQPSPQRNITVREALNRMALQSFKNSKPVSWRFFFRREPMADTGLGGYPIFQTF